MKAVPKVNTDGLYIEDALVEDAFSGVVPFYAEPPVPDPEQSADPDESEQPEEQEPEIAGYIVGVPVPPGLYLSRFDLAAWEAYQEEMLAAEKAYREAREAGLAQPEDERGEPPPAYVPTEMPMLWIEGLTLEEIEEITRPQPQEPSEFELLGSELANMKLQNIQQQAVVSALGSELTVTKLTDIQQQQMISELGAQLAAAKLEIIKLKGGDQE